MEEVERKSSVSSESVGLDEILKNIGNFGKYQLYNCAMIIFPVMFTAWYTTAYVFTAGQPELRCTIPECDTNTSAILTPWLANAIPIDDEKQWSSCTRFALAENKTIRSDEICPSDLFDRNKTIYCDDWIYGNHDTIVSEFSLGCQQWKSTLVGTMNNVGQLFCAPLTGFVSDKYGRRLALVIASVLAAVLGVIKALSPNYWVFLFLEFLEPAFASGTYMAAFILAVELVGPKRRTLGSLFVCISYAVGEMMLGLLAWLFPYWRTFIFVIYIPSIFIISYLWLIPESVRWLLSRGEFSKAGKVLTKVAKVNGTELSEKQLQNLYSSFKDEDSGSGVTQGSLKDVFCSKILLARLFCCAFWWITCTLVYYGLSLNAVSIAGNMYLNFVLVSLIEIPGYLVYYFTVDVWGRKASMCWSFLGSGLACIAFIFISEDIYWLKLSVYLLGKFCITVSFTVLYVYTTELFPTPLRHSTMGLCSMAGRIGSIVAPQSPLLASLYEPLPLYLFGITSIISGLTSFLFPETNKKKLPDTIEEAENISV